MRFRLVEDVNRMYLNFYDRDWQDVEKKKGMKDKTSYIMRKYMDISNPSRYPKLKKLLEDSIDTSSFDPNKNNFLAYLLTLSFLKGGELRGKWDNENVQRNLDVLNTRALGGDRLNKEWYYDVGTLNRPYKEFTYVINIANVLSDDSKRGKYFSEDSHTDVANIYKNGKVDINDDIKEPGIGSNDTKTIYGMINEWSRIYGVENKDDVSDEKYSIKDVLDYIMPEDTKKYTSQTDYLTKGLTKLLGDDGKLKNFNDMQMQAYRQSLATRDKDRQIAYINEKVLPRKTLQALADYLVKKSRSVR